MINVQVLQIIVIYSDLLWYDNHADHSGGFKLHPQTTRGPQPQQQSL